MPNKPFKPMSDSPNPVDVHVGKRLRSIRKAAKVSQTALADHLGVSFQQVQKYESGANRLSASKMFEAASFLAVPVGAFYADVDDDLDSTTHADAGLRKLIELYKSLNSPQERRRLLDAAAIIARPVAE